jgi:hypothetical protein
LKLLSFSQDDAFYPSFYPSFGLTEVERPPCPDCGGSGPRCTWRRRRALLRSGRGALGHLLPPRRPRHSQAGRPAQCRGGRPVIGRLRAWAHRRNASGASTALPSTPATLGRPPASARLSRPAGVCWVCWRASA